MVKECNVKINNEDVTVVEYGNMDIQFPAIRRNAKMVYVSYQDGKYSIVNKGHKSKSAIKNSNMGTKKKTTNKKIAKETEILEKDIQDA